MNKTIYIACAAKTATGGTELLHQLAYALNKQCYNANIFYFDATVEYPLNERFENYTKTFVTSIVDDKENILVVPETYTELLYSYKNIRKCIWWLSVDNYLNSINFSKAYIKRLFGLKFKYFKFKSDRNNYFHFYQSEYAKQFLISKDIRATNIFRLSDYLNETFLKKIEDINIADRRDVVLYNPMKGYKFTQKIISNMGEDLFIPIKNMTPQEISELLLSSKLYIDFGNHPGKDRFPREAAAAGCCVLVGKRGSAKYYEDIPIADQYKMDERAININSICKKISFIIKNYESINSDFESYRNMIKSEKEKFYKDVKKVFSTII